MPTTRKQRANWRRVSYFVAHCLAYVLLPQYLKVPVFAAASLIFCFSWISCNRIAAYWEEEFGEYHRRAGDVLTTGLYPETMFAEDILRRYIREGGLEKDEAKLKAAPLWLPKRPV